MTSKYIPKRPSFVGGPKSKPKAYPAISLREIKEVVTKAFLPKEGLPDNQQPDYYTPKEISPGLWKIGPLYTGNAGKATFEEQVRLESQKLWKESSGWKK